MINKNNNYRVMKFLEPVNKKDICKGYVRLDVRGQRGLIIVSVENIGDHKSTSEIYLYKDKKEKLKLGTVNNRKGTIKKNLTFAPGVNISDYNICGVVKDERVILYANLYSKVDVVDVRKLEETVTFQQEETENNKTEEVIEAVEDKNETIEESSEPEITENNEEIDTEQVEVAEKLEQAEELEQEEVLEHREETKVLADNNNVEPNVHKAEDKIIDVESASRKTKPVNKFEQRLYNSLGDENKIEPLSVKIKNLTWWKVPYDDKGLRSGVLPFYSQIISSYYPFPISNRVTTCQSLMKKYGHYLFGVYKENNNISRFVYGVPGEFNREEQPYKGATGFKNWSYKNKNIDGNYGYWVVFVNATTGEVTEPPQTIK